MRSFDVIVIGAGPAGEVAAGRLAGHGLSVAIVEDRLVGGECSFWACMPSKALLRPYEALAEARRIPGAAEALGGELDVPAVLARRDEVIHDLDDSGQLPWLEDRGIALVRGFGRLTGERRVRVHRVNAVNRGPADSGFQFRPQRRVERGVTGVCTMHQSGRTRTDRHDDPPCGRRQDHPGEQGAQRDGGGGMPGSGRNKAGNPAGNAGDERHNEAGRDRAHTAARARVASPAFDRADSRLAPDRRRICAAGAPTTLR
jgi:hypothetical protein